MPKKKLLDQRAELVEKIRELRKQRDDVVERSTAVTLARIDKKNRELRRLLGDIDARINSVRSGLEPTDQEKDLHEQILATHERESVLLSRQVARNGFPRRYIRPDATEFFRQQLDEKEAELAAKMKKITGQVRPGPRLRALEDEVKTARSEWKKTSQLCELGEKIFKLRQEREQLQKQKQELQEQREQEAVSKAVG